MALALIAEMAGGFVGGLIAYTLIYLLYYGFRKLLAKTGAGPEPEYFSRTAKMVIIGLAAASAVTTPITDSWVSGQQEDVWFHDSSYYGEAPVVQMQDMTYRPPANWYYTDAQFDQVQLSDMEVVAPKNASVAVLTGWMPYNATHEQFFQDASVETFKRNLRAGTRGRINDLSNIEVIGDNYTKWFAYNGTIHHEGRTFYASYQVSVSQGRYYSIMYYGLPDDYRQHYDQVIETMRNTTLYHPITIEPVEVPEIEPVNTNPYQGFSDSFGLKEGYRYVYNKSMKGRYRFDVNATDPVHLIIMKEEEYAKHLRGEESNQLYREHGGSIDFEREFFKDNYTLYFYNNEGDASTVEFDLTQISNSTG